MNTKTIVKDDVHRHPIQILLLALLIVLVVTLSLAPPQILRIIIDGELTKGMTERLLFLSLAYVFAVLLCSVFDFLKTALLSSFGQRIVATLRLTMAEKLSRLSIGYYTTHTPGEVTSHFSNDAEQVNALFSNGLVNLAVDLAKVVGIVISIAFFSLRLAILCLVFIPLIVLFTRHFRKAMFLAQQENLKELGKVNGLLSETLRSLHMTKAYAKERYMRQRYEQGLLENFATIDRVNFYDSVFSAVITTLKSLLIATVVVLSSDKTGFLGITIGMLAASIDLVSDLFRPIDALGMEMEQIQKGLSGIAGIDNFLASEEEPAKDERLALQTILPISQAGLTFSHVSFRYPDGDEEVFHNLDFSIAAGSHIAFVGRTGIGKSTLFRLVLGLLPPTQGKILLNGIDVTTIPTKLKRRIYGYVDQNFVPVEGGIIDQVGLHDASVSESACRNALTFVGLADISCPVDELSQGQKQLLSIARAIVCDPPLLLFDETTASLDSATEHHLVAVLEKASQGKTVLSISHRLDDIRRFDKIISLEDGRIKSTPLQNLGK